MSILCLLYMFTSQVYLGKLNRIMYIKHLTKCMAQNKGLRSAWNKSRGNCWLLHFSFFSDSNFIIHKGLFRLSYAMHTKWHFCHYCHFLINLLRRHWSIKLHRLQVFNLSLRYCYSYEQHLCTSVSVEHLTAPALTPGQEITKEAGLS